MKTKKELLEIAEIDALIKSILSEDVGRDDDIFRQQLHAAAQATGQQLESFKRELLKLKELSEKAERYGQLDPNASKTVAQAADFVYGFKKFLIGLLH